MMVDATRIEWGPIHAHSEGAPQVNYGAELHSVTIGDVVVTAYVQDETPVDSYINPHVVVAARANPDGTLTFGAPYSSAPADAGDFWADLTDLCYIGNNVVMIGGRRNPSAIFLKVDPSTLSITEIGSIAKPGDPSYSPSYVRAISDRAGNGLVAFDYDGGSGYQLAWVTTDGNTVNVTLDVDTSDSIAWQILRLSSHHVVVDGGVAFSSFPGARVYQIDWAGQSWTSHDIPGSLFWSSFPEEAAITTRDGSTIDVLWPTTSDTLRIQTEVALDAASMDSTKSPIGGRRIGQASNTPYAQWVDMVRLPGGSFLFTWMKNAGGNNDRTLTWFEPGWDGYTRGEWPVHQLEDSSFWYYDGLTLDSFSDGRFVLVWTEVTETVNNFLPVIYWRVGKEVPATGGVCEDQGPVSLLDSYRMGEGRAVASLSPTKTIYTWWSDTGDPDYEHALRVALIDTSGTVPALLGESSLVFPDAEYIGVDTSSPHTYRISDTRGIIDLTQEHDFDVGQGYWVMVDASGDVPVLTKVVDTTYMGSLSRVSTGWGDVRNQRLVRVFLRRPDLGESWVQVWDMSGATPSLHASGTITFAGSTPSAWAGQCAWDGDDTFVLINEGNELEIRTYTVSGSTIIEDDILVLDGPTYGFLYEDYRTSTPTMVPLPDGRVFFTLGDWYEDNTRNLYTFKRGVGVEAQGQISGESLGWMVSAAVNSNGDVALFAHDNLGPNTFLVTSLSVWRDGVGVFSEVQPIEPAMPYSGWYTEAAVTAAGCKWLLTRADTYAGFASANDQRLVICEGCGEHLIPPLRIRQRDDVLGLTEGSGPRLAFAGAAASSAQQQRAPRLGAGGKPVSNGLGQVYL